MSGRDNISSYKMLIVYVIWDTASIRFTFVTRLHECQMPTVRWLVTSVLFVRQITCSSWSRLNIAYLVNISNWWIMCYLPRSVSPCCDVHYVTMSLLYNLLMYVLTLCAVTRKAESNWYHPVLSAAISRSSKSYVSGFVLLYCVYTTCVCAKWDGDRVGGSGVVETRVGIVTTGCMGGCGKGWILMHHIANRTECVREAAPAATSNQITSYLTNQTSYIGWTHELWWDLRRMFLNK